MPQDEIRSHRPRAKKIPIHPAKMVQRPPARPSLALEPRPLPHLGSRSNAPANPHRRGNALLPAFPGSISKGRIASKRSANRSPETLVRSRLLQPRPQSARRRERSRRAPQRRISPRSRCRPRSPRHRRLHRRRGSQHRLRCPASRARWQRRPRPGPHPRHPRRRARTQNLAHSHRRCQSPSRQKFRKRSKPIPHGTRRSNLHSAIPALRHLPRSSLVPRLCKKSRRTKSPPRAANALPST